MSDLIALHQSVANGPEVLVDPDAIDVVLRNAQYSETVIWIGARDLRVRETPDEVADLRARSIERWL